MNEFATALVQLGPEKFELQNIPLPKLRPGDLLVRVEANGLCHTDLDQYWGRDSASAGRADRFPRILGHEIVGTIEAMGAPTLDRDGLTEGDRVGVSPFATCGACEPCARDKPSQCRSTGRWTNTYGFIPTSVGPHLWGGCSTHVYVPRGTRVYPFPRSVHPFDAAQWNMLAGGIQWAVLDSGLKPGEKVAVLGCGQRGIASVAAAREAGAGLVLTTGLTKDRHKLDLSKTLGADIAVDVETEDLGSVSNEVTEGSGFDVVVDTTPYSLSAVQQAIDVLRPGGRLMLVGLKTRPMQEFPIDNVIRKQIKIIGCHGQSSHSYRLAAKHIIGGTISLSSLRTHVLEFTDLPKAIELLGGTDAQEHAINIVLTPPGRLTQPLRKR